MNQSETDILIVGAGAAGLTLAMDLARRGISFRLVEKMSHPFVGSRGKGIQPRTQEILEDFGILDRVVARGGVYPPQRKYKPDGRFTEEAVMESGDPTPAEPHQLALMVPQFATEQVFRDKLRESGHSVEFGKELIAFTQDDSGVTANIRDSSGDETVRCRFLVGTDGGRSFVRQSLGIGFPGKTLGVRALVADVRLTSLGRDAWHRLGEGDMHRQVSLCPLMGTDLFQLQAPVPLEGDVDLTADGLTRFIVDRTARREIQIVQVTWASTFHMNARLADRYRIGRVFLAGDAAHTHPPNGGQGLNTSIQDAYNLGWKLAAVVRGAPQSLLDSYEAERRPVAMEMLGLATSLLEAMKRGLMRRGRDVHQLDIGYPKSALSVEAPSRRTGIHAGQRAPDAPIRLADGRAVRFFELLRGPQWTLVGNGATPPHIAAGPDLHVHRFGAGGDVVDDGGHFSEAYGLRPEEWLLIRPDGHVGAFVASKQSATLEQYLARVGLARGVTAHA